MRGASCGNARSLISPRRRSSVTPAASAGTSPAASCSGRMKRSGSSISHRPRDRRSTFVLKRTHPDDLDVRSRSTSTAPRTTGTTISLEHRLVMSDGSIRHIRVVARGMTRRSGPVSSSSARSWISPPRRRPTPSWSGASSAIATCSAACRSPSVSSTPADWWCCSENCAPKGVTDLGSYFDSHPDFLRTCMDALSFQEANERAIQMFGGGGVGGYVGRSMADTWKVRPDTFRRAMESRFRGETNFEEETKMVTWDGRVVDVLFTTARVGPINDLEISLVATIDISQRVRAQERLRQVQAEFAHAARVSMLGELTASIAHEVNQPLAAIATNGAAGLRWLNRPIPDMAEVRSAIENMATDTKRAANIVARVHGMASRKAPERAVLSLDDVIREALLFLRHEMESRGVTILHRPDADGAAGARRPHPASAGDRQSGHQRRAGDDAGGTRRMAGSSSPRPRRTRRPCAAPWRTTVPASPPNMPAGCSKAFSRPRTAAWAWACRSAGPSSKRMAAGSTPKATAPKALAPRAASGLRCRSPTPASSPRIRSARRRLTAAFALLPLLLPGRSSARGGSGCP